MTNNESSSKKTKMTDELLAAIADVRDAHALIDSLVDHRNRLRLNQKEVANRMGVSQSTVAGFESEMNDPKISTVQRYARAIGVKVVFKVESKNLTSSPVMPNWLDSSWSDESGYAPKGLGWVVGKAL